MNRQQRRAAASMTRQSEFVQQRPEKLTPVSVEQWPNPPGMTHRPTAVWCSRKYLVQVFDEKPFNERSVIRITVCRTSMGVTGKWQDQIAWEELQQIKEDIGFGDQYAIEIYPRDCDLVNVANMRHLWVLQEPLPIGWFNKQPQPSSGSQS